MAEHGDRIVTVLTNGGTGLRPDFTTATGDLTFESSTGGGKMTPP
ncbi:hypothetical protein [Sedimentitalea nanhaiensis]|nr:hypothetical protein [Sedimentitalea nanhaiensis]